MNLRLVPYWERGIASSSRREIIVDPGPSFGSGDHPTTIMALEFLETVLTDPCLQRKERMHVLDVGTGTGVLAIAAALLGVGVAYGLDIDAASVFTARRNVALNGLAGSETAPRKVELFIGSADAVRGPFSMVTANLAAPTLLKLAPTITEQTARFLILSGIADAMVDQILETYTSSDLRLLSRRHQEGWHGALLCR